MCFRDVNIEESLNQLAECAVISSRDGAIINEKIPGNYISAYVYSHILSLHFNF